MKFPFATENFEKSNIVTFGFYKEKNEEKILNILRKISYELEPIDIKNKRNYFEKLKIYDFGNLKINRFDKIFETLSKINKYSFNVFIPHLFSLFSTRICKENDGIIVFDAHADLKDVYENEKYNRATWLRRLLEIIDEGRVLLIGIRSLDEDELYFLEENGINYITSFEIHENIKKCLRKIKKFEKKFEAIYISFDVDVVDSCYVKTFYPEAYGLNLFEIHKILDSISSRIRAIDFCEFYLEEKDIKYGKNVLSIMFKLISLFRNNFL